MKTEKEIIQKIDLRLTELIYASKEAHKHREQNCYTDAKVQELLKLLNWIKN